MPRPGRPKKKPPIEISDNKSISTFTFSSPSPSPGLFRIGEKRGYPQSSTVTACTNASKPKLMDCYLVKILS
jgi:hypothetical protein